MNSVHDMEAARSTYEGLLRIIRYSVPVIAVLVAFVLFLITR